MIPCEINFVDYTNNYALTCKQQFNLLFNINDWEIISYYTIDSRTDDNFNNVLKNDKILSFYI